jgi:hypothetical protein
LDLKVKKGNTKISGFFRRLTACQPSTDMVACFMNKRKSRESYKSRNTDPYSNLFNTESNTHGFQRINSNSNFTANSEFISRASSLGDLKGSSSNELLRHSKFLQLNSGSSSNFNARIP